MIVGFYNVVEPCVAGKLHYATVPSQPINVDDETATPLVESGYLEPYRPGKNRFTEAVQTGLPPGVEMDPAIIEQRLRELHKQDVEEAQAAADAEPKPTRRPRSRRRED